MKQPRLGFLKLAICACITTTANAQKVYKYNLPGCNCYSEIIFEEKAANPKGVIVLDANGSDIVSYSNNNEFDKSKLFTDYDFLYINILNNGTSDKYTCYDVLIRNIVLAHKINPSVFYYIPNKSSASYSIHKSQKIHYDFNIVLLQDENLADLKKGLDGSTNGQLYKLPNSYRDEELEYQNKMLNYKRNFDVGLFFSPIVLTGNKLGLTKDGIGTYGLDFTKHIAQRHSLRFSVGAAFNIPGRKSMQSGMQSKMMEAVQNEEDSFYINETLSGHVYISTELSYRYYFRHQKPFRPYLGVGVGLINVTSIAGKVTGVIDISDIDMSNPSSMQEMQGNFSQDDMETDMSQKSYSFMSPMADIGFEYKATPGIKLAVSMPIRYNTEQSMAIQNSLSLGLNMGIHFTLNPGKLPKNMSIKKK